MASPGLPHGLDSDRRHDVRVVEALREYDNEAEVKAWVLGVLTDEVILDGLRSRQQPR